MKTERMLGIITELTRHRRLTARQLSEKFEVSERTIHRDVEAICMAGIPLVTYQGNGGGIGVMEGFRLDGSVLTRSELDHIVLALRGLNSVADAPDIARLLGKLQAQESGEPDVSIDLASRYKPILSAKIALLRQAIKSCRVVEMDYYTSQGGARRVIEPYYVIYQWSDWYVYAYCRLRGDFRLFKLNRSDALELTGDCFERRPVESLPDLNEYFNKSETRQTVVLLVDRSLEYLLVESYGSKSFQPYDENNYLFSFDYVNPEWMLQYVLSFGGKAKVLEPESLAEEVCRQAEAILANYK